MVFAQFFHWTCIDILLPECSDVSNYIPVIQTINELSIAIYIVPASHRVVTLPVMGDICTFTWSPSAMDEGASNISGCSNEKSSEMEGTFRTLWWFMMIHTNGWGERPYIFWTTLLSRSIMHFLLSWAMESWYTATSVPVPSNGPLSVNRAEHSHALTFANIPGIS